MPVPTQDDLLAVAEAATHAPSVHNSQPWRFTLHGDGLDVHADFARQLTAIDPTGRQLRVSCGAAVACAEAAARSRGYDAALTWLPDPDEHTLLARLALVPGRTVSADDVALADAVAARHTYRGAFADEPLADELVARLEADAAAAGVRLHQVTHRADLVELAVLLEVASDDELRQPSYREELARWVSASADGREDGIPVAAVTRLPGEPVSEVRLREFVPEAQRPTRGDAGATVADDGPPPVEHPAVLVLDTDDDSELAWLQAGHALGRVLLRLTAAGAAASPLNQVVDHEPHRTMLANVLGLLGRPQMVLRAGYAYGGPATPRRPLDAVVTAYDDEEITRRRPT